MRQKQTRSVFCTGSMIKVNLTTEGFHISHLLSCKAAAATCSQLEIYRLNHLLSANKSWLLHYSFYIALMCVCKVDGMLFIILHTRKQRFSTSHSKCAIAVLLSTAQLVCSTVHCLSIRRLLFAFMSLCPCVPEGDGRMTFKVTGHEEPFEVTAEAC